MAAAKDFYKILGVGDKATDDEIKKSYRNLAKQYHPDANPDDPSAAERFKGISEAYSVLSDADQRKKYDTMRRYGAFGAGPGGFSARRGGGGATQGEDAGDTHRPAYQFSGQGGRTGGATGGGRFADCGDGRRGRGSGASGEVFPDLRDAAELPADAEH